MIHKLKKIERLFIPVGMTADLNQFNVSQTFNKLFQLQLQETFSQ
jgi:hypothetical protein